MPLALVVGASRGLGLGLAQELFARSWDVVATARNPGAASGLAALAKGTQGRAQVEQADVDTTTDLEELHKKLVGRTLDLLFLNAGIWGPRDKSPRTFTPDDIAAVMMTNVFRTIGAAQIMTDLVRTGTGVVGFMSSRVGSIGFTRPRPDNEDLYRASKAALNALVRSYTARLADPSITVLALSPGLVKTDMTGDRGQIDVATSVRGVADVLERARGTQRHGFFRYDGEELPW